MKKTEPALWELIEKCAMMQHILLIFRQSEIL